MTPVRCSRRCGRPAKRPASDARLHPLATLEEMFIAPSRFHVIPVLAYSPDPGPVAVVDETETAIVARVPVRAFINPENRIMVYRKTFNRRFAGPAFLLNEMLVWGFTGQVISCDPRRCRLGAAVEHRRRPRTR